MILIDLSQVLISNLMVQTRGGDQFSANLVRHMILNSIRALNVKFSKEFGEIVICCDDKRYWRKEVFPHYKARRKKDREDSGLDWQTIFKTLDDVKNEFRDHMPYKVLQVDRAEADDIIGALCHEYGTQFPTQDKILIVSGDKDFIQLQTYVNVSQYAPIKRDMLISEDPGTYLKEHIMLGDSGDGIPNFLSPDDTFVAGKRQNRLTSKRIEDCKKLHPNSFCKTDLEREGYKRNEMLVDLSKIPDDIRNDIVQTYKLYQTNPKSKIFNYFVTYRLGEMLSAIQEF